jgi:hypothetical protein
VADADPVAVGGVTLVTVITAPDRKPGSTAHSRSWRIPARLADVFAEEMTAKFGEPIEGLSSIKALRDRAETNAADGYLFTDPENADG